MATNDTGRAPRAVIHKRILEAAETRPDASMEALAADLTGASPALVERVLEEYGDPGREAPAAPESSTTAGAPTESGAGQPPSATPEPTTEGSPATDPSEGEPMTIATTPPTAAELTDKQRETLRAIAERPDATQAELADHLGVSRATVNKRVNRIEGFEWSERRPFVEAVFGADAEPARSTTAASDGGRLLEADDAHAVEQLQERVARVEQQLGEPADAALEDAELLAKVVRAVLADDTITEAEELRVIEALL